MYKVLRRRDVEEVVTQKVHRVYEDRVIICDHCNKEIPLDAFYYIVESDNLENFHFPDTEMHLCKDCLKDTLFDIVVTSASDDSTTVYCERNYYTSDRYTKYINSQKEE